MKDYKHIKCDCGGIIGMFDRDTFNCEKCNKEYQLHKLDYDICLINDKTGWIFPMIMDGGFEYADTKGLSISI